MNFEVGKTADGWWFFDRQTRTFTLRDASEGRLIQHVVRESYLAAMRQLDAQMDNVGRYGNSSPGSYADGESELTLNVDAALDRESDRRPIDRDAAYVRWLEAHAGPRGPRHSLTTGPAAVVEDILTQNAAAYAQELSAEPITARPRPDRDFPMGA